jgi:ribosome maturation factor RimP
MEQTKLELVVNEILNGELSEKELFIVDITISPKNEISLIIDSNFGVDILDCSTISRHIENTFDRDQEDYELTVGSAGLSTPFKIQRQYQKYLGKEISVLTQKGEKIICTLSGITENGISAEETKKIKIEKSSKKQEIKINHTWNFSEIKAAIPHINFNQKK